MNVCRLIGGYTITLSHSANLAESLIPMGTFLFGVFVGVIVGAMFMWRRMRQYEKAYKEVRQTTNPLGDRRYHPDEISPAMMQLVELMVEKKLQLNSQSQSRIVMPSVQQSIQPSPNNQPARRIMQSNGRDIEVFDDGTWGFIT